MLRVLKACRDTCNAFFLQVTYSIHTLRGNAGVNPLDTHLCVYTVDK